MPSPRSVTPLWVAACALALFAACAGPSPTAPLGGNQTQGNTLANSTLTPEERPLTARQVVDAFIAAKLPVTAVEEYNEETDLNKLLGRPNQYVEKINFDDGRYVKKELPKRVSIEIFKAPEDLEARKKYTETFARSASVFNQYIFAHKNALVRLPYDLTPKQAGEYEAVLKSL